jgi:hypothetical protein
MNKKKYCNNLHIEKLIQLTSIYPKSAGYSQHMLFPEEHPRVLSQSKPPKEPY